MKFGKADISKKSLRETCGDFKPLFEASFLLIVVSSLVLLLEYLSTPASNWLSASRSTPWGVITSLFVHYGFVHFAGNMLALLTLTFFFVETNRTFSHEEKIRRSRFAFGAVFASAVSANIIYVFLVPVPVAGASGAVYALMGIVLWFAVSNVIPDDTRIRDLPRFYADRQNWARLAPNLVILGFLPYLILYPVQFLGVSTGVNSFVHGASFLISFLSAYAYQTIRTHHGLLNWIKRKVRSANC